MVLISMIINGHELLNFSLMQRHMHCTTHHCTIVLLVYLSMSRYALEEKKVCKPLRIAHAIHATSRTWYNGH